MLCSIGIIIIIIIIIHTECENSMTKIHSSEYTKNVQVQPGARTHDRSHSE